jgi:hypothetical protein
MQIGDRSTSGKPRWKACNHKIWWALFAHGRFNESLYRTTYGAVELDFATSDLVECIRWSNKGILESGVEVTWLLRHVWH